MGTPVPLTPRTLSAGPQAHSAQDDTSSEWVFYGTSKATPVTKSSHWGPRELVPFQNYFKLSHFQGEERQRPEQLLRPLV